MGEVGYSKKRSKVFPKNPENLMEILLHRGQTQEDKMAYAYLEKGEGDYHTFSYGQLAQKTQSIAAILQKNPVEGERVLLLYPPGLEFIAAFYGCFLAKAIAVPVYPPDPARLMRTLPRFMAIVKDSEAKIILTTSAILALADALIEQAPWLGELKWLSTEEIPLDAAKEWVKPKFDQKNIALLQYTSGSTSDPKGVIITHQNLMENARNIVNNEGPVSNGAGVLWLPMYHDLGLVSGVLQPLYLGGPVYLMSPTDFLKQPRRWLQAMSRFKATHSGAPTFAYDLVARKMTPEDKKELDLSHWCLAYCGGEPVRSETLDRFYETFKDYGFRREAFMPCYGLAEATLMVSCVARGKEPSILSLEKKFVELGPPPLGTVVRIIDPLSQRPCSPNEIGEIWVKGPSVGKGYWNRPEETRETFYAEIDGEDSGPYLRTGDLGFLNEGLLYFAGRLKDLIILRGKNHYPQDFEKTVENCHPALRPGCGAAFSLEYDGEEKLVIIHEINPDTPATNEQIEEKIRKAIVENHDVQVHTIALIEPRSIDKTSSGKIQRQLCKKKFVEGGLSFWKGNSHSNGKVKQQEINAWLVTQLSQGLNIPSEQIDPQKSFAHYGLDSISAFLLMGQLEKRFGGEIQPQILLEYPNIESLSRYLEEKIQKELEIPLT